MKLLNSKNLIALSIIIAGYFIGQIQKNAIQYNRTVVVKGLSEMEKKANLAIWPFEIKISGNNLKALKKQMDFQKNEVLYFLNENKLDKNNITLGTYNIFDAYSDIYNKKENINYRYTISLSITIMTKDIKKLKNIFSQSLNLIDKNIVINSKNTWHPIQYLFTNLNAIKPNMIQEATKNARAVAEKFAKDSNSKVGKIKSANQGMFSISDKSSSTPEIKLIRIVSTIEYFIKD